MYDIYSPCPSDPTESQVADRIATNNYYIEIVANDVMQATNNLLTQQATALNAIITQLGKRAKNRVKSNDQLLNSFVTNVADAILSKLVEQQSTINMVGHSLEEHVNATQAGQTSGQTASATQAVIQPVQSNVDIVGGSSLLGPAIVQPSKSLGTPQGIDTSSQQGAPVTAPQVAPEAAGGETSAVNDLAPREIRVSPASPLLSLQAAIQRILSAASLLNQITPDLSSTDSLPDPPPPLPEALPSIVMD